MRIAAGARARTRHRKERTLHRWRLCQPTRNFRHRATERDSIQRLGPQAKSRSRIRAFAPPRKTFATLGEEWLHSLGVSGDAERKGSPTAAVSGRWPRIQCPKNAEHRN